MKGTTKDELFLLKLYEMAMKRGDVWTELDRYAIGQAIGQNDKGVDTIVVLLAKANFIKKYDEKAVFLTQNGLNLVNQLLEERKSQK